MSNRNISSILVVDDDKISILVATTIIESVDKNYPVTSALNGEEALQILRTNGIKFPLLILLDLNMPVLNGFGFLEEFERLEFKEKTYIAVVSSSVDEKDKERASQFNVIDYVEKPLSVAKLRDVIDKCAN